MKKFDIKKTGFVLILACAIVACLVGGCTKNVDTTDLETSDSGTLRQIYGIPQSISEKHTLTSSNPKKAWLIDDDITVPVADSMNIEYVTANGGYADDDVEDMLRYIFDDITKLRLWDQENYNRVDLEAHIAELYDDLANYENWGDSWADMASEVKEEILEYEAMLETAKEEYPLVTEYVLLDGTQYYMGDANGETYKFYIDSDSGSFMYSGDLLDHRPLEGCTSVTRDVAANVDASEEYNNLCTYTESQAESIALEFLAAMGIEEMAVSETDELCWTYENEDGDTAMEKDGYYFIFTRQVEGVDVSDITICNVESLYDGESYPENVVDSCRIMVDSTGVILAGWSNTYAATGDLEENVTLLSWDELMSKLDATMSDYFDAYPSHYGKVEFIHIELTYWILATDTDGVYAYTPVWMLSGYNESDGYSSAWSPEELCIINAVTGDYVDIEGNSKAIGTYVYSTDW